MPDQFAPHQVPSGRPRDAREESLRLLSGAAHDLVGPVNQIASLVELFVRRYRGQLDEEARQLLTHIESAGIRLSATATGLGTYFQVIDRESRRSRVNFTDALSSVLLALRQEIRESQAEITFGDLPDVEGDPDLVMALLRALLENSLKFYRAGSPPRIRISAESSPAACRFSVIDNGIGIDPRYYEDVFLPFKKLNGNVYRGGGMGLTIARATVDALGGKIWIADTSPPGTAVVFDLLAAG